MLFHSISGLVEFAEQELREQDGQRYVADPKIAR